MDAILARIASKFGGFVGNHRFRPKTHLAGMPITKTAGGFGMVSIEI